MHSNRKMVKDNEQIIGHQTYEKHSTSDLKMKMK